MGTQALIKTEICVDETNQLEEMFRTFLDKGGTTLWDNEAFFTDARFSTWEEMVKAILVSSGKFSDQEIQAILTVKTTPNEGEELLRDIILMKLRD